VSQWAEIRQMFFVGKVPKREIARRFGLDVKTVRRALQQEQAPLHRRTSEREQRLDPWRGEIERLLREEPRLTAKRMARLLEERTGPVPPRTMREYVAQVRRELFPREVFVHRTHRPGKKMEGDFGESLAVVAGRLCRVKFFVGVLPASNRYFGRAFPVERLECLLEGLQQAFLSFGGVPEEVVLDNTALAVKEVLRGRDRREQEAFQAFRGAYPFHAEFCAPGKGWEKGSVEGGVDYVRDNVFRPIPEVRSFEELNARIQAELDRDLDARKLPDGRTVRQAWEEERAQLRPLPACPPPACRTVPALANKFALVRADRVSYSVPLRCAYRPVMVRLYPFHVELAMGEEVVARHVRKFEPGTQVIDPFHVLPLLEQKHRAVSEATALQGFPLPERFHALRAELRRRTRKPDQEWVGVLRLLEGHERRAVEQALEEAWARGSPRLETIRMLLREPPAGSERPVPPAPVERSELAQLTIEPPTLRSYDGLAEAWS